MMQAQHTDTFRESVLSVLGAPPDPAPLMPEVIETVAEEGFRREKIKYQVSLNEWAYAYLLIPDTARTPAPIVYVHHRRTDNYAVGKSEAVGLAGDKDYAVALELVQRGYITFAPDALGFEDRRAPESDGDKYDLAYNFHQLALRLLRGETLLKKVIWDVSRGIDYLETRTEVDRRYIGFMGHGYGGKMALWAAALEPRIKAAVAHCGVMTYRENLRRGEWFQVEFVVPRLMQVADVHHILSMVAPRPFLLSMVEADTQNTDAGDIYAKALPVYEKKGVSNRLAYYRYPGTEALKPNMRLNAYNWLDSWLLPY